MNQENDKLGYTLGDLLKMIHKGQMSLAQASHYGSSFYDLESAIYAIETLLSEERGRVIEEILPYVTDAIVIGGGERPDDPDQAYVKGVEDTKSSIENGIKSLKESP